MKILFDTSVLVEIERKNEDVLHLMEKLTKENIELGISAITISELLVGPYLQEEITKPLMEAKNLLGMFKWHTVEGEVAEESAKIEAYKLSHGIRTEFQDNIVAATFITSRSDYLLTLDIGHFKLPSLKSKVFTPLSFHKMITEGKINI